MKIKLILVLSILVLAIAALIFLLSQQIITGETISEETVKDKYSYTKAICDETHCQDYEIVCEGNKTVKKSPITGLVPHEPNWQDPREESIIQKEC